MKDLDNKMTITRFFENKIVEFICSVFLFSGVLIIILTPDISFFKWTAGFAIQTTILYVIAGLFFLIVSQTRLLFLSFFCAACLSLFLKLNFNPNLKLPAKSNGEKISFALINLVDPESLTNNIFTILKYKPDVICLYKQDSVDAQSIIKTIKEQFPYSLTFHGVSFKQLVFSKHPFISEDTIMIEGNPQPLYSLKPTDSNKAIYISNTFVKDPWKTDESANYRFNLSRLIVFLKPIQSPLLIAGNFNSVAWSGEMNYFRKSLTLENSRRAFLPSLPNLMEVPKDHIFFNKYFNCVDFHEFRDVQGIHLGIFGTFQLSNLDSKDN